MKPLRKLTIAAGKYTYNGETKTRWVNIGTLFQKDNGTYTILMNAGINLAAYSSKDPGHEGEIWVNLFEIDKKSTPKAKPEPNPISDDDPLTEEDIPF